MMKVALINPRTEGTKIRLWFKKITTFYRITFPVLASYTPQNIDLTVIEENVEDIDFNKDYDLIGITVLTSAFNRAKDISEKFKEKGSTIVWGGIHPTVLPTESKRYADSIVIGAGEIAWKQLLSDFEKNSLKSEYFGSLPNERILPDRSVLNGKSFYNFDAVETSRGCSNSCDYCSVPVMNNGRFNQFSIDSVIEDIQSTHGKYLFFVDDNLIGNPNRAKQLFQKMRGLGKKWLSQAPVYIANDDEMLRLAAESGCIGLYLGLESVSEYSLKEANKKRNKASEFKKQIKKIHDYGISIETGFIFGFDADSKGIFEQTLEFIDKTYIDSPNFHILTPYPGTKLYNKLKLENRLLHQDWSKYNTGNVVFYPKNMSLEDLQEGYNWINKQTYDWGRIIKRTIGSNHPLFTFIVNASLKGGTYHK